jgi:hypothetical protein
MEMNRRYNRAACYIPHGNITVKGYGCYQQPISTKADRPCAVMVTRQATNQQSRIEGPSTRTDKYSQGIFSNRLTVFVGSS